MVAKLRFWLSGLFAALFVLAIGPAPAEHARAVLQQTVAATMQTDCPHGMHGHGAPAEGHDRHQFMPACMACVLMMAPGLPAPAFTPDRPIAIAVTVDAFPESAVAAQELPWLSRRARAPPAGSIA